MSFSLREPARRSNLIVPLLVAALGHFVPMGSQTEAGRHVINSGVHTINSGRHLIGRGISRIEHTIESRRLQSLRVQLVEDFRAGRVGLGEAFIRAEAYEILDRHTREQVIARDLRAYNQLLSGVRQGQGDIVQRLPQALTGHSYYRFALSMDEYLTTGKGKCLHIAETNLALSFDSGFRSGLTMRFYAPDPRTGVTHIIAAVRRQVGNQEVVINTQSGRRARPGVDMAPEMMIELFARKNGIPDLLPHNFREISSSAHLQGNPNDNNGIMPFAFPDVPPEQFTPDPGTIFGGSAVSPLDMQDLTQGQNLVQGAVQSPNQTHVASLGFAANRNETREHITSFQIMDYLDRHFLSADNLFHQIEVERPSNTVNLEYNPSSEINPSAQTAPSQASQAITTGDLNRATELDQLITSQKGYLSDAGLRPTFRLIGLSNLIGLLRIQENLLLTYPDQRTALLDVRRQKERFLTEALSIVSSLESDASLSQAINYSEPRSDSNSASYRSLVFLGDRGANLFSQLRHNGSALNHSNTAEGTVSNYNANQLGMDDTYMLAYGSRIRNEHLVYLTTRNSFVRTTEAACLQGSLAHPGALPILERVVAENSTQPFSVEWARIRDCYRPRNLSSAFCVAAGGAIAGDADIIQGCYV